VSKFNAQPEREYTGPVSARNSLDALSAGECDEAAFMAAVSELCNGTPDATWEVLSLLDQYYRRGKIDAQRFHSLKTQLQQLVFGADHAPPSVPPEEPAEMPGEAARAMPEAAEAAGEHLTTEMPGTLSGDHPTVAVPGRGPAEGFPPVTLIDPIAAGGHATVAVAVTGRASISAQRRALWAQPAAIPAGRAAASGEIAAMTPRRPAARAESAPPGSHDTRPARDAAAAPGTARTLAVGDVLRDRYRIQAVLGRGGMGTVFDAVDEYRLDLPPSGQRLAIKVLHSDVTQRPDVLNELRSEFQHLQSLSHPHIVRVHEFDRDGDLAFFTMELLSGSLLSRLLGADRGRTLPRAHALAVIRDVGGALAHAHARGVVHGDIKPHNIFISEDGSIRVLDFGSAHTLIRGPWISDFESPVSYPSATPAFASCQVLEGLRPDARDDLYSFSCVAYILLTGKHPFDEVTAVEARGRRMQPARPAGLTRLQWQALRQGLQWERHARPADATAWLQAFDLRRATQNLPALQTLVVAPAPSQRNWTPVLAGVGGTALVIGAFWLLTGPLSNRVPAHSGAAIRAEAAVAMQAAQAALSRLAEGARRIAGSAQHLALASAARITTANGPAPGGAAESGPAPQAGPVGSPAAVGSPATAVEMPAVPAAPPVVTEPANVAVPAAKTTPGPARAAGADPLHTRVELAADAVEVAPDESVARVTVRRRGGVHGDLRFKWWTEPGSAKAGQDFVPVEPRDMLIPDGRDTMKLVVPVVSDLGRRHVKDFYVAIGEPDPGTVIGARTQTEIIILAAN
jgi:hypothetical protein